MRNPYSDTPESFFRDESGENGTQVDAKAFLRLYTRPHSSINEQRQLMAPINSGK
jgi:hypothetical protein